MVTYTFNARQYEADYEASGGLPIGKHIVAISASEFKPTKDGTGTRLVFTMDCLDGPAKGGKQTDGLNINNKSQAAMNIALKQLSAYCTVVGMPDGFQRDTAELHGRPFVIEIGAQTAVAGEPARTEVKNLFDLNGRSAKELALGTPVAPSQQNAVPSGLGMLAPSPPAFPTPSINQAQGNAAPPALINPPQPVNQWPPQQQQMPSNSVPAQVYQQQQFAPPSGPVPTQAPGVAPQAPWNR